MRITRKCTGRYRINHNGYIFDLNKNSDGKWVLFNHAGIELYRDDSKKAVVNMLSSYSSSGCAELHLQEYCTYA